VRAVSGRNLVGGGGGGGGGGVLSSGGGGGGGAASSPLAQSHQSVAWGPAQGGGGGGGGDLGVVANPLVLASMAAQRAPSSRSLSLAQQQYGSSSSPPQRDPTKVFKRYSDEGETWYVCEATGAAVWELPAGAFVEE
jgi:hypothetical protein